MSQVASSFNESLYAQLCSYIDILGTPILALYGIDSNGNCGCPKGVQCGKNAGKHPRPDLSPSGVKSATVDKRLIKRWIEAFGTELNFGLAIGHKIPGGGFLVVLDCDPRNGSEQSLEAYIEEFGQLPETPTVLSGGGGQHYFFRCKEPPSGGVLADGLDKKGVNSYVVAAPSRHFSGKHYLWDANYDLLTAIADAPGWIVTGAKTKPRPPWTGKLARDSLIGAAFLEAKWAGGNLSEGRMAVHCPWAHTHTDGRGKGGDSSTVILPPSEESSSGGFVCAHSHCKDKTWKDAMAALPVDAVAAARKRFTVVSDRIVTPGAGHIEFATLVTGDISPEQMITLQEHLLFSRRKDGSRFLKKDLVNIVGILKYDPRWQGVLRYDHFRGQIQLTKEPPWHPTDRPAGRDVKYPRQWEDADDNLTRLWLSRMWGIEWDGKSVNDGAIAVAQANGIHPVREYLENLEWDGVERLDNWLMNYCGAANTEYTRSVGKWWLISGVARIFDPGCSAQHVLILEGKQGTGKSTTFRILGKGWFSDSPISIGEKDAFQNIRGQWIIELAELDSLNRSDAARAKAFFTSAFDTFRPSYGRATITVPRQCIFGGSVNHSQFLRDETGNRRYWPVLTTTFNTKQLAQDVDQLWAEAKIRYKAGDRWYPLGINEIQMCSEEQSSREFVDAWEPEIARWLLMPQTLRELEVSGGVVQQSRIFDKVLKLPVTQWGASEAGRINRVMLRLGWTKNGKTGWKK